MDGQTEKRFASVQHIKQKLYYRPGVVEDPDPFEACPTRAWRCKMKEWVLTLKRMQAFDRDRLPQKEDAARNVISEGSQ